MSKTNIEDIFNKIRGWAGLHHPPAGPSLCGGVPGHSIRDHFVPVELEVLASTEEADWPEDIQMFCCIFRSASSIPAEG